MAIFFYKGLTRNPEVGNMPIWVLAKIWRLQEVRNIKLVPNVSNEILLNAAKCKGIVAVTELLRKKQRRKV